MPRRTAYPTGDAARRVIAQTVLYVEDRLDEDWTLRAMAEKAGYEEHHFAHAFRDVVGVPPVAYVRALRLERAAHDLVHAPEKSLAAVAHEAHYASVEALRRAFAKTFGRAPSDYRRSASGGELGASPRTSGETVARPAHLVGEVAIDALGPLEAISLRAERFDDAAIEAAWRAFWPYAWPSAPFEIGAMTPPWGFVTESRMRHYRCFRLSSSAGREERLPPATPDVPLEVWRCPRAWYARFDFEGPLMKMHALYEWIFSQWLSTVALRYAFLPVVTLFDGQRWMDTRFCDARARVYVPVRALRTSR